MTGCDDGDSVLDRLDIEHTHDSVQTRKGQAEILHINNFPAKPHFSLHRFGVL